MHTSVVWQFEVGRDLRIPWRKARRLLELQGVEILTDGKRRWLVRRPDWERVRPRLLEEARSIAAGGR